MFPVIKFQLKLVRKIPIKTNSKLLKTNPEKIATQNSLKRQFLRGSKNQKNNNKKTLTLPIKKKSRKKLNQKFTNSTKIKTAAKQIN